MTIQLTDGRRLAKHVEKALGSVEVPMSDRALEAKFAGHRPRRCARCGEPAVIGARPDSSYF